MHRFYSPPESFKESTIILNTEETRHLRDVLRLRAGDEIRVFDAAGREYLCKISEISKKETQLQITEEVEPSAPESKLNLTLAVALLKGEKFDLVIQKACELGVSRIVPLQTIRADVKIKDARENEKKLERWRRIVLEASKQCGRAKLMEIEPIKDFKKFVAEVSGNKIFFSERNGRSFAEYAESVSDVQEITAVVGAEGGWEDSEIELAKEKGFEIVTLGGRILRAETAAIAISALLQNHFGDLS